VFPRGDPATWLVAGATAAGMVAAAVLRLTWRRRQRAKNLLRKAVYISEQVVSGGV